MARIVVPLLIAGVLAIAGCKNPRDRDVPKGLDGVETGSSSQASGGMGGGIAGMGGMAGGGMGGGIAGMGGMGSGGNAGGGGAATAPDFSLFDVNPASPSYWQPVSPRDQLTRVSGWYFGHAT